MSRIIFACICLLFVCGLSALPVRETSGGFGTTQKRPKASNVDPNLLHMEVKALETLHHFKATAPQLQKIAQVAKSTKAKAEQREAAKAGADYVNALKQLRDALIAKDEDAIEKLQEQLEKIEEKNSPQFDDEFDITDAARKEVDGLYRMLSPRQLVIYADSFGDDLLEPVEVILRGLEETRMLKGKESEEARDDLAEEVSWLVAGWGGAKAEKIRSDVSAFLNREHGKAPQASVLVPKIRQIIETPDPLVVLRNVLKHDLALLLSNPQLEKAVRDLNSAATQGPAKLDDPLVRSSAAGTSGPTQGSAKLGDALESGTVWEGTYNRVEVLPNGRKHELNWDSKLKIAERDGKEFKGELWLNKETFGMEVKGTVSERGAVTLMYTKEIKGKWRGDVVGKIRVGGSLKGKKLVLDLMIPGKAFGAKLRMERVEDK